jgi:hypothetical protein
MSFGLTYDTSSQQAVLYGGLVALFVYNASAYSGETWSYTNGTWALLATNGSVYNPQGMVYDASDNETVLLGSNISWLMGGNLSVVTWTFSGTTWAVAAPAFGPLPIVMDAGQSITLRVTESPNGGGLSYSYSGLPSSCSSMDAAQLVCVPEVPGTYHVVVTIRGSAGYLATARTTLDVNAAPAVVQVAASTSVGEVGIALGITVTATPGTGTLVYSYLGLPTGCVSANTPNLACVPQGAGSYTVGAEVTDALGVTSVRNLSVTVVPALAIATVTPNHPAIDQGQVLEVTTNFAGGVGPFAFGYGGLPAGCATANQGALSCRPSTTGTFGISVMATDSLGASSSLTGTVTVNALPSVGSFVASSETVAAGGSVQLTASVTGGTGPLSYAYQGLPAGCVANGGPTVACSGTASGQFTVVVTVTDATGATATRSTEFTVAAASHPILPGAANTPAWLGGSAFEWGLLAGLVGIAVAGIVGGNRLRLSRQGQQIVRDLREQDPEASTGSVGAPDPSVGAQEENP